MAMGPQRQVQCWFYCMRPLEAARQGQTEKITGEKEATIILKRFNHGKFRNYFENNKLQL
jgi:hypothetical protein